MSSDNNGLVPGGDETGNVLAENWLTEDGSTENVADGSVGGLPHRLEVELSDTILIRGDGGTLNPNIVLLDGVSSLNGDLVSSCITVLNTCRGKIG
jgi:hypothetical protein